MRKVLILAGEQSGVLYGNEIAARLRDCEIRGYADYGFATEDLAVMGFFPVIRRIFYFLRVRRVMKRAIREWRPDTVLTIDYPGMNLSLAAYAKVHGIRAVHVVSPQVWAWKKWKIPAIERSLDRLCCFLPFEPRYYRKGLATFVGHPLFDAFARLPRSVVSNAARTLAILPGSRAGEIERILPLLLSSLKELRQSHPQLSAVIPAANARARSLIEAELRRSGVDDVEVRDGGARELLRESRCAVVASGTATLEAALARCPTVLVYRVGAITAAIARLLITGTKYVGLANIIWDKCGGKGDQPMVELLQEQFTVERTVAELRSLLEDDAAHDAAVARLDAAMQLLSSDGGAITRIAAEI